MAEEQKTFGDAPGDGDALNVEVCRCACHNPLSLIVHIAPCCRVCLQCGRRIRREYIEAHHTRHQAASSSESPIGATPI